MKKSLMIVSTIILVMMMVACASSPEAREAGYTEKPQERRDIPDWFLTPPKAENAIYGLGLAQLSSDSLSRNTAIARARTDIAFQVSVRVKSSLTDYLQDSGTLDTKQAIEFVESITKQVVDIQLNNTTTEKVYATMDGKWYAMVSYPKGDFVDEVADIFERNEGAAFAEFKAQEAMKRLESELSSNPPKSEVKDE